MAKRRRKRKSALAKTIGKVLPRLLLIGGVLGGYYVYQNPEVIFPKTEEVSSQSEDSTPQDSLLGNIVSKERMSEILGITTGLVEEGLETIKIPKKLSGSDEEIVIQDAFDQFSQKIKDLPEQQVDKVKIQFCEDILESVDNASVVVEE